MTTAANSFDINQEHPEYSASGAGSGSSTGTCMWVGSNSRREPTAILVRRQKEPLDVYAERLSRSFYENYIGSIVDWYTATLFRREPVLTFEGNNERARKFFGKFIDDCDLKGASIAEFFGASLSRG